MKPTPKKRKQRAEDLLFLDVLCPIDKAVFLMKRIRSSVREADLIRNEFSEKTILYSLARLNNMTLSNRDKWNVIRNHVESWTAMFGEPSLKNIVRLCDVWDCPIQSVYDKQLTPAVVKEILQMFIIGQDKYCDQLAQSFSFYNDSLKKCYHTSDGVARNTLLVYGPSGTGKTYGVEVLCRLFNLPYLRIQCDALYINEDLPTIFRKIYLESQRSRDELEQTVVCFDKIDKLLCHSGQDMELFVHQIEDLIDDNGEVSFLDKEPGSETVTRIRIPTSRMLFLFTGEFAGLEDAVRSRLRLNKVGFITDNKKAVVDNVMNCVSFQDLHDIGTPPEIYCHTRSHTSTGNFSADDLVKIINSECASPLLPILRDLHSHNIYPTITPEAKRAIAEFISKLEHGGARNIAALVNEIIRNELSHLLGKGNKSPRMSFEITKESVTRTINHDTD